MSEYQWNKLIEDKKELIKEKIAEAKARAVKDKYRRFAVYIWNRGDVCIFEDFAGTTTGYVAEKRNECKKICEIA